MKDRRDDFLLEMYRQTSSHLNRHILVTWQSVGVVAGALAVFVLGDKFDLRADLRLDFVIGIVVLLCAWSCAHLFDANNWFDRNLHIITNIERQFLVPTDSAEIHYYFASHRNDRADESEGSSSSVPKMITHLKIQLRMATTLWVLVLLYHFYQRILPGFTLSLGYLDVVRSVPYIMTIVGVLYCMRIAKDRREDYKKLRTRSPGRTI